MEVSRILSIFFLFLTFCGETVPWIFADEWRFGVIPDTQWSREMPFDGVAIHVIDAINAEMIRQKVDFVIAVGDLADGSSLEALQLRNRHNETLYEAGIKFYPLRGNHDSSTLRSVEYFTEVFPDLPGTPGNGGSSPTLPNAAGKTYAFAHKEVKLILLDSFPLVDDGSERGKAYSIKDYLPWLEKELEKGDHRAAFVFSHLALVGQKHKSNLFGKVRLTQDNHSDVQNTFYSLMEKNGVKFLFCGHDHLYHRSRIASPDRKSQMQQVICGSASHKFYRPKYPFASREKPLAQELNRVGFLIGHVDDESIRFEYYSTDPFGEQAYTPNWELRESFGHDFKGDEFEQTAAAMKTIYRPTILSVLAMPEAIAVLSGFLVLVILVRIFRSKRYYFSAGIVRKIGSSRLMKWRNLLPILFVLTCIPAVIGFRLPFESHTWDHLLEISCLFVGLFGLAIRALTHGYEPSTTDPGGQVYRLDTGRMHAFMRHPLVFGNFFLFLAPVLFLHTWWLVILYIFVFLAYAVSMIREKEKLMRDDYGLEYLDWAARTPRIFPKTLRWMIPGSGFSWKKALLYEYRSFFGFVIVMTALEHLGNFMVFGTFVPSPVWTSFLAFGAGTYLIVYSLIGTSLLLIVSFSLLVGASKTTKGQQPQPFNGNPALHQYQPNPHEYSVYDTLPPPPQPEFRFEPLAVACVPPPARPFQGFSPDERRAFQTPVPQKPTHLCSLFSVADNTKNQVFDDYRNFYTRDNALNFGVAVMGSAVLANTQMDHNFQRWYHKRTQCWTTDRFSEFSKTFGEGKYFIPITVTTAFVYRYWQERTGNQSVRRPVGDFFGRTARGYAVGAPTLLIGQYLLGGDRPRDGSSYWRPLQQNHGISGHAFIGATPFITAAQMTDNFWAKSAFYTLSILPAWSRVNDDAHYLSQAVLGWYLSYLSVRAVSETEGLRPLPKGLTLFPVFESNGAVGVGLIYRR